MKIHWFPVIRPAIRVGYFFRGGIGGPQNDTTLWGVFGFLVNLSFVVERWSKLVNKYIIWRKLVKTCDHESMIVSHIRLMLGKRKIHGITPFNVKLLYYLFNLLGIHSYLRNCRCVYHCCGIISLFTSLKGGEQKHSKTQWILSIPKQKPNSCYT